MDADELAGIISMLNDAIDAAKRHSRKRGSTAEFQRLVAHAGKLLDMLDEAVQQHPQIATEPVRDNRRAAGLQVMALEQHANLRPRGDTSC